MGSKTSNPTGCLAKGLLFLFGFTYGLLMLVQLLSIIVVMSGFVSLPILTQAPNSNQISISPQINSGAKATKDSDVRDYVERQVDRSYTRFFNQFK